MGESTEVMDRGRPVTLSHLDGSPRNCFGHFMAATWQLAQRLGSVVA